MTETFMQFIENLQFPIGFWEILLALGFSLAASLFAYFMYQVFYGSSNIGAGVHRTFIIGGPAITVLLLAIQTSIPLSLGLLGSLSIVRFRTPVKDPAEIGFLLLVIASSICAATNNYLLTIVLFILVFSALSIQRLTRNKYSLLGRGHLMLSLEQESFQELEKKLADFLNQRLRGLSMESISTLDDKVSIHYQYRRQHGFDWAGFTNDLQRVAGKIRVEMFISQ